MLQGSYKLEVSLALVGVASPALIPILVYLAGERNKILYFLSYRLVWQVWKITWAVGKRIRVYLKVQGPGMATRELLKLPSEFVLHCLGYTFGTRLGESGADAFTIMKQRYVHPSPESIELESTGGHGSIPAYCSKSSRINNARVAKSADAKDLKSFSPQGECGFNSRPGHTEKSTCKTSRFRMFVF